MEEEKIRKLINVEDRKDPKVHHLIYLIMRDRRVLPYMVLTLDKKEQALVILLGERALGWDIEETTRRQKDVAFFGI